MKCKKAERLISLYLDNELDKEHEDELNKHLETCSECRKDVEFFENLDTRLYKDEIAPSSDFKVKFWERFDEEENKYKEKFGRLVLIPVYAAVFLFLLITTFSASMLYAYKSSIKDNSVDRKIIGYYLQEGVFSAALTPVSCYRFFSKGEKCIREVCKKEKCQCGNCPLCKEEEE